MKAVLISGVSSEVGKTVITTGIMKALSKKYDVQGFKVGPDYIDPSYHYMATGNPGRNLDSFFMNEEQIKYLFQKNAKEINIIEGVRGLYEGFSPTSDVGSSASIAKILGCPVILIVNAKSITRSAVAIVKGFLSFDNINIRGVIFNQVRGEKHIKKLKEAFSYYLPEVEILGFIPRTSLLNTESRHLGLVPTAEKDLSEKIEKWGEVIESYLDLSKILEISDYDFEEVDKVYLWEVEKNYKKVGVAYDEAFNFYYWDNFDALKENGAKIKFFSPLHDKEVPDVDLLYIGGGYPELFKERLSKNKELLESLREFDGYIYGECGGLMYLSKSIDNYPMASLLDCKAIMTREVQGLSYVIAKFKEDCLIGKKDKVVKGHEFHYSKLVDVKGKLLIKILRGKGIINNLDGLCNGKVLGSYFHNHAVANPYFASCMVNYDF
ncbi:Ni-sirohydrochlorin a,c-diamide synthase [Methanocaldococcus infernus]